MRVRSKSLQGAIKPEDRLAIRALVHEYYWFADHGPMEGIVDLYAEDGRLIGAGRFITGWPALRVEVEDSKKTTPDNTTRHVSTNLRLTPLPDGSIQGVEYLRVYRRSRSTARVSRCPASSRTSIGCSSAVPSAAG